MPRRSRRNDYGWGGYRPYVPMALRRRQAALEVQRARKRGTTLEPVHIEGRAIATTAWGRAWCDHIESFHDFVNRLPRGRTYVRNGSVLHLEIRTGEVRAQVIGSDIYAQRIELEPCKSADWECIRRRCAGGIGSLIELLEGRISSEVMATMTMEKGGLLPDLKHVRMGCSCPDWASLCKHLAAVLYGVGARLDERPELLFLLRGVDPAELVASAALPGQASAIPAGTPTVEGNLSRVFGIELDEQPVSSPARPRARKQRAAESGAAEPRAVESARASAEKTAAKRGTRAAAPRTKRKRKISRQELLETGVPSGTICTWLHKGILRASDERGVYIHTPKSRSLLVRYGA